MAANDCEKKCEGGSCGGAHQNSAAVGKFTNGSVETVSLLNVICQRICQITTSMPPSAEAWDFSDRPVSRFVGSSHCTLVLGSSDLR